MAKIQHYSGGRRVSQKTFWDNIHNKVLDMGMAKIEDLAHGAGASIVDPATDKHAPVFTRRVGTRVVAQTEGSPAFAQEFERRLGVGKETITSMQAEPLTGTPVVYLAHAHEDHDSLAQPLARRLMAEGIEVWLDGWEIRTGDSLKRKMEEGLEACTHFLVLLTPHSVGKPWVEREIDAGFMKAVQSQARFMGLRIGVEVSALSIFLRTVLCPAVNLTSELRLAELVADIHGVTTKPPRGPAPRYVKSAPAGPRGWSTAASQVAEHLVRSSANGVPMDPMADFARVAEATGLPEADVRLGVLDLEDAGLIERSKQIRGTKFWPRVGLFVEFDRHFLGFDTRADAVALANWLLSHDIDAIKVQRLYDDSFSDWGVRRFNSALLYLEDARLVETLKTLQQGPFPVRQLSVTDRTRRFVRDHG